MTGWTFRYDGYEPDQEGLREALCTLGNGYMATRGAAPESVADGTHYPGTYVAGLFNRLESEVADAVIENESMVNLPNWLPLTFRIDGGPWFSIDEGEVLDLVQELDLRQAVLHRRVRHRDRSGRTTVVTQRRLVSMAMPHACALETTIHAEDWSGRLEIRSGVDGNVQNRGVERYHDLASDHLDLVNATRPADDTVLLEVETNQSHVRAAMAARTIVTRGGQMLDVERREIADRGWIGHDLMVDLRLGEHVVVDKVVTVFTDRDRAISEPAENAERWLARLGDFTTLLSDHVVAWAHLWERFCFEADGSTRSMRIMRVHLLHLLQTVSPNSVDLDVGVPARGLHGEAYRGHIFWDELFILPILNLRLPSLARSLLGYRYRRLPEARHAAAAAGYRGAMYPWQSGSDGREENQQWHLNPVSGRWNPDPTHLQHHIGIAIAYNVWQYYQATDDREFLRTQGVEMLVEIARFWSSIATYDSSRDRYVIRGVMGPDEFHSGYPGAEYDGIDNNAYTNLMAVWVMCRATDALGLLSDVDRQELREALGLDREDLEQWQDISRKMFVPFHGNGIISQFEGYEHLEEFDWEGYRHKHGDIRRLDRILEAEDDTVNRYQASKQADVLMLLYLLSADELRELLEQLDYQLDPDMVQRNIDYYLARTSHGSTLSSVVHAWVLARANRDHALEFYEEALVADVADIQGGTTPEGIHLAAMCGSIDILQRCFSGIETRNGRLIFNPYWPESFGELSFSIVYHGVRLGLRITGDRVIVSAGPGLQRPIQIGCREKSVELKAGSSVEVTLS